MIGLPLGQEFSLSEKIPYEAPQPLTVEESDRAVRLLRVQTLAEETHADNEKANRWLRDALTELDGETRSSSRRLRLAPA